MQATAILPVKRFGAAKSRLADVLPSPFRSTLAAAMLADVLDALGRSERLERVLVVSGEPLARKAAQTAGVEVVDDADDAGHSQAAALGVRAARDAGAECVALLPGDCPLLRADELDHAIGALRAPVAGVIPDRHGDGTNGLLLAPPDAIGPSFGPGSRDRHLELARRSGAQPRVLEIPSLALDLDTGDDLRELVRLLAADPGVASRTAETIDRLELPEPE